MAFLIGVIILILFITFSYIYIKTKINKMLRSNGLTSLKDAIEEAKLEDQELPKSLSSMDSIYMDRISKDFPELNINELKRVSEEIILNSLNAIEKKNSKTIKNSKIKAFVENEIEDLKDSKISYSDIRIHKTVLSKYENDNMVATIYFSTGLEYYLKKDNNINKKVQDRFKTEFIYVIDEDKVESTKRVLGINCPNCGAAVKTLKDKNCSYCGTKIIDLVKRVWSCNDITRY